VSHPSRQLLKLLAIYLALVGATAAADSKTGWNEIRTAHVILRTDLSFEDAERAAILVERARLTLLAAGWPGAKSPQDTVQVVVLSSHQEFQKYFGEYISYKLTRADFPPTLFLYGSPDKWEKRLTVEREEKISFLNRALVLHLEPYFYRRLPKWFAMGLAEFLEPTKVSEDGQTGTLGYVNLLAISNYKNYRSTTVADALVWGRSLNPTGQETLSGLEGVSYVMVLWGFNVHPAEFVRFQKLLVTGMDPEQAWKTVFTQKLTGNIDQTLNTFAQAPAVGTATFPIPETEIAVVKERPMNSADVHATRAEAALAAKDEKEARWEISAALADDPANVRALRLQAPVLKPAERLAVARKATVAHAEDGLAWLLLGDALKDGGTAEERRAAYRKAIELSPNDPDAFAALALLEFQEGHASTALPLAQTAVRIAPWDASFLDTLAAVQAGVGRCSEALSTEARAVAQLTDQGAPPRAEYSARLASIPKDCTEASASPPSPPDAGFGPKPEEAPAPIPPPPGPPPAGH
jgi:Flp pilus assembly protein TadD